MYQPHPPLDSIETKKEHTMSTSDTQIHNNSDIKHQTTTLFNECPPHRGFPFKSKLPSDDPWQPLRETIGSLDETIRFDRNQPNISELPAREEM